MYPWIESIALRDGVIAHLMYHQSRINKTLSEQGSKANLDLRAYIASWFLPSSGLFKVRVVYNREQFVALSWDAYEPKRWQGFELVEAADLRYPFKSANRACLDELKEGIADRELIITQQGFVTDTTYSNLVFKKKEEWFTPHTYLLPGTQRRYLLDHNKIKETEITQSNLASFTHFKLINAMMPLSLAPTYSVELIHSSCRSFIPSRD